MTFFERTKISCPLEHYRFCRSLLFRVAEEGATPQLKAIFLQARRYPYAESYQPSCAALALLARIFKVSNQPVVPGAAMDAPLPFAIAWQLSVLWNELGDEDLIDQAKKIQEKLFAFGERAKALFYTESAFQQQEADLVCLARISHTILREGVQDGALDLLSSGRKHCQNDKKSPEESKDDATDCADSPRECEKYGLAPQRQLTGSGSADAELGMIAFFDSCLTLTGSNSSLGSMYFGNVSIPAFGPQADPLSDSRGFGISQKKAHGCVTMTHKEGAELEGWTRCEGNRESWLYLKGEIKKNFVRLDTKFAGRAPYMVFYVRAAKCFIESEGKTFSPKSLNRYQGRASRVLLDDAMQLEARGDYGDLQIIPLAGNDCFWNANFLLAFSCPSDSFVSFLLHSN